MRCVGLDWNEGEFFDADGRYLICATHGARYDLVSGARACGPCGGQGLVRVAIEERDRDVRLANEDE